MGSSALNAQSALRLSEQCGWIDNKDDGTIADNGAAEYTFDPVEWLTKGFDENILLARKAVHDQCHLTTAYFDDYCRDTGFFARGEGCVKQSMQCHKGNFFLTHPAELSFTATDEFTAAYVQCAYHFGYRDGNQQ